MEAHPGSFVRYSASTFMGSFHVLTDGRLEYALRYVDTNSASSNGLPDSLRERHGWVTERFINGHPLPRTGAPTNTRVSRFIGSNPAAHSINQRTFENVTLGEVYPGIVVDLRASGTNVEKIFTVWPGSDPARIALKVEQASDLRIADDGSLLVTATSGTLAFTPPVAYQIIDGVRTPVSVRYHADASTGIYGFVVGAYDATEALIIDPLLQATYVGGTHDDRIAAMAIDSVTGDVIVAGAARSTDLPCAAAASACGPGAQAVHATDGGTYDGFVARLSADLTQLKQVTYLGGNGEDRISAVAIHPVSGEVFVAGRTKSTDLPCTTALGACGNGAQIAHANDSSNFDGFVARLSPDLSQLQQTTYLGGNGDDAIFGFAIHPVTGEIVVGGRTGSTDLPCTVAGAGCANGAQTTHADNGMYGDGFVARLSSDLTQLKQASYIGGNGGDLVSTLIVHPSTGEIVVTGQTSSTNLPCTTTALGCADAAQPHFAGVVDGLLARLSADLTQFKQVTYIGGTGNDFTTSLAVQPVTGAILVGGYTESTDLPCTTAGGLCGNGAQSAFAASGVPLNADGFVARFSPSLTQLFQVTYYGGSAFEFVAGLAVHPLTEEVWAAGGTGSTDVPCTMAGATCSNGAQASWDGIGGSMGFVVRFSPELQQFRQATYLGDDNEITAVALHPVSGEIVVAGNTVSTNFPCTTLNPPCGNGAQPAYAGGTLSSFDGFVARLTPDLALANGTPDPFAFAGRTNVPRLSIQTSIPAKITGLNANAPVSISGVLGATYCISSVQDCSCNVNGGFVSTPGIVGNDQYACVRQTAPAVANAENFSALQVGPTAARFYVSTGAPFATGCSLDIDDNGSIDALSDGLMLLRAMFGLTGTSVTNNAVGSGAQRNSWAQIRAYLNSNCGAQFAP